MIYPPASTLGHCVPGWLTTPPMTTDELKRAHGKAHQNRSAENRETLMKGLGRRLIMAQPDTDGGEFDCSEEVERVSVVSCGYASELFELVEVPLDEITLPVYPFTESEAAGSGLSGRDVGPCASLGGQSANGVTVVGAIGEQDCIGLEYIQHGGGGLAVMRLPGRQDDIDWPAFGIDKRVNFGREPATGTSHATIVGAPFFAVAACW